MSVRGDIEWVSHAGDASDPLEQLRYSDDDAFYFARPAAGLEIAATGVAAVVVEEGPRRFVEAGVRIEEALARVRVHAGAMQPLLVGGFAFHDAHLATGAWRGFPSLRLVLPRSVVMRDGGRVVRAEALAGSYVDAEPSIDSAREAEPATEAIDEWSVRVGRALADIRAGRVAKVVLSRSRTLRAVGLDPIALVAHLRSVRPECATFFVRRGGVVFLGSTPETLVSVRGGVGETMALAGSMRPRAGESNETVATRLLACPKNTAEHEYVASAVRAALGRVSTTVDEARARHVVRLPELHHLATTYRAVLRPGVSALAAAAALHPTPAVGGVPIDAARARLAREEPGRGWYAGGVGWIGARGDGDWAVALRCALLRESRVDVFAGAGIVAGSDPIAEWDETEAKMTAMLRLFGEHARAA